MPCLAVWLRSTPSFSTIWSWSTLFLSSLIRVYTICHSQQSDQGLHYLPLAAVWSRSRSTVILRNSLIRVYTNYHFFLSSTVCHSQQSDLGLHYLPFSVWSRTTLFVILSNLIRDYTVCHSQQSACDCTNQGIQSDQGLQYLPFSVVWSGSTLFAILSLFRVYTQGLICNSQHSYQGVHYIYHSFQTDLARSIQFAILNLIRVYTICHSQHSDQGLHYLPSFPSTIIKVYTVCHSQQYDQGLYYLQFSIWSGFTISAILGGIISVYSNCHSQQSDQYLHYLSFSADWSVSTVFAILSNLIMVYTICCTQHFDQGHGLHCHSQEQSDHGLH